VTEILRDILVPALTVEEFLRRGRELRLALSKAPAEAKTPRPGISAENAH